ncbi:MAG: diguanylate cyclase [Alphaproteobacteria bacterium]
MAMRLSLRFSTWAILPKVMAITAVSVVFMMIATFGYYIPLVESRIVDGRMNATQNVVEVAHGVLVSLEGQVHKGGMTEEQAKTQAVAVLRGLRYHEKEYFWINDLQTKMVLHPIFPDLEGKDLTDFKDPNGKYLFRDFVELAQQRGGGFVRYLWPKPGNKLPVEKVSFVKLFEPWGWVVGSGIYMDDVRAELNAIRWLSGGGMLVVAMVILAIAALIGRSITTRLTRVIAGLREIASGGHDIDLSKRVAITSIDEIGILSTEFNSLMEAVSRLTRFKKVIEEDDTLEEVYLRLSDVFVQELGLADCVFYEINQAVGSMTVVYPPQFQNDDIRCDRSVLEDCALCKARRTGHRIASSTFPNICRHFHFQEKGEHICVPLTVSGGAIGVIQFLFPSFASEAESTEACRRVSRAEQYIKEAIPVIEAKRLLSSLRQSALTDPLTGTHNRRFLDQYIESLCAGAMRRESRIGVLMCDVDYFKQVNDRHGHNAGDEVLRKVADRIRSTIRQADILVRFGGEEFLVLLMDVTEGHSAMIAEKIRAACAATPFTLPSGAVLEKTMSIGVAEFPTDSDRSWQVVKFADVAMYRSKEDGRDRVTRFSREMWAGDEF